MGTIHAFPATSAGLFSRKTLSAALEARRQYVRREISSLCRRPRHVRVLCIGVNGLRDLEGVLPVIEEAGGEVVVLERDECRVEALREEPSGPKNLEIVPHSGALIERSEFGRFDFIYAPHLLNSLNDIQAKRSLARLAAVLRKGGRLLLSSLSPEVVDSEYQVNPVHTRTEEQLSQLTDHIADACFAGQIQWRDDSSLLIFLEVHR